MVHSNIAASAYNFSTAHSNPIKILSFYFLYLFLEKPITIRWEGEFFFKKNFKVAVEHFHIKERLSSVNDYFPTQI